MSTYKIVIATSAVGAISVILAGYYFSLWEKASPVVITENGKIQGRVGTSRGGKEYAEYLSIPFAEPPVGSLRFESPIPVKSWKGIKQATKYPSVCAQMEALVEGRSYGSEDCLYLNIFTHLDFKSSGKKKPVMVHIHGGGFLGGGSNLYRPTYFMDHEIVLVQIQYRLGPLGFLNTGDGLIRGNMGMKDQRLALQWIQKNIEQFGGDSKRITLCGDSAGAASVHFHLISKSSEGLVHRAILQSGAAIGPWAFLNKADEFAVSYGGLVGCSTDNTTVLVDCLKDMHWKQLVQPQRRFKDPITKTELLSPSLERVVLDDMFLVEHPRRSLEMGKFSKIPLLLGANTGEGAGISSNFEWTPELIQEMDSRWEKYGGLQLLRKDTSPKDLQKIRKFYFGSDPFPDISRHSFLQNLTNLLTDVLFLEPVRTTGVFHAKHGAPTYLYYFDYDSATRPSFATLTKSVGTTYPWIPGLVKIAYTIATDFLSEAFFGWEGPHQFGIPHGDDATLLWDMPGFLYFKQDVTLSKKYVKMFVDFATNEEPLHFDGIRWPPIETKNGQVVHPMKYMMLDRNGNGQLISEPFTPRMHLWGSMKLY